MPSVNVTNLRVSVIMGVGTDDGTYYADDREYHAEQAKKISLTLPDNSTPPDIDDRRDESTAHMAVHYIADSLNPSSLADLGQAYTSRNYFGNLGMAATSRMPQVETPMSDDLGYKSIPQYQQPVDKTVTDADINQGINPRYGFLWRWS